MNILVACHFPPGFGNPKVWGSEHHNLYQLNTNAYKANKTRKNTIKNLKHKGDRIYYLDKSKGITWTNNNGKEITISPPPNNTPNWFPDWDRVPDASMDIIWTIHCPLFDKLGEEEPIWAIQDGNPILDPPGEGYLDDIWRDLLGQGVRILKSGGKIVIPYFVTSSYVSPSIGSILQLNGRILNMEVIPDHLYKINVIEPLSEHHTTYLQNLYIVSKGNFYLAKNTHPNEPKQPMNLGEAILFLVFEKP